MYPLIDDNKMLQVLKDFLYVTADVVYVVESNGKVLDVNKKFEECYGLSRDEIIGKDMPLTPKAQEIAVDARRRFAAGEKEIVLEGLKVNINGRSLYLDVTISAVMDEAGELLAVVVIERDMTDRIIAQEMLRNSEERYRVLVESSPEPILVYQENAIVFANPAAVHLLGTDNQGQLIGKPLSRFFLQDDWKALLQRMETLFQRNEVAIEFDKKLIRFDNKVIYVEYRAVLIDFQGQKSIQLLFRDVSDRKYAEMELAAKEREFSRILKLSPEPIVLHQGGYITFVNDRAIKLLKGTTVEDFIGLNVIDFVHPDFRPVILQRMKMVTQIEEYLDFVEIKIVGLNGEQVDVELSSVCVNRDVADPIIQVVVRDLTERKRTEEMIRRSDKLSIAGELAAGVAHEIRNPLTALRGFMQLLGEKNTDYVDIMLVEIDRISYIVNEFIGMAKPQALHFVSCDLFELLNSVIGFMNPQANMYNVQVNLLESAEKILVPCEPNQIKQVYINVLKNAIESMPNGGVIDIVVEMQPDGKVVTQIIDQGVGIPEERMDKIGEPFYSLKESGTGLGLMVCHRIMEAHKGKLSLRSVLNEGTTVEIELPLAVL